MFAVCRKAETHINSSKAIPKTSTTATMTHMITWQTAMAMARATEVGRMNRINIVLIAHPTGRSMNRAVVLSSVAVTGLNRVIAPI